MKIAVKYQGRAEMREAFGCGVPGLAISGAKSGAFGLIHVRSGLSILVFDDPEAALAGAQALAAELLADWTISALDIADEVSMQEVLDVAGRWGGRLSYGQVGDVADVAAVSP